MKLKRKIEIETETEIETEEKRTIFEIQPRSFTCQEDNEEML